MRNISAAARGQRKNIETIILTVTIPPDREENDVRAVADLEWEGEQAARDIESRLKILGLDYVTVVAE